MYSNFAILRHLHTLSSSLNVDRMYAHSLLTTVRSSAAVRAALICRIRSRKRVGAGILTVETCKLPKCNQNGMFSE